MPRRRWWIAANALAGLVFGVGATGLGANAVLAGGLILGACQAFVLTSLSPRRRWLWGAVTAVACLVALIAAMLTGSLWAVMFEGSSTAGWQAPFTYSLLFSVPAAVGGAVLIASQRFVAPALMTERRIWWSLAGAVVAGIPIGYVVLGSLTGAGPDWSFMPWALLAGTLYGVVSSS